MWNDGSEIALKLSYSPRKKDIFEVEAYKTKTHTEWNSSTMQQNNKKPAPLHLNDKLSIFRVLRLCILYTYVCVSVCKLCVWMDVLYYGCFSSSSLFSFSLTQLSCIFCFSNICFKNASHCKWLFAADAERSRARKCKRRKDMGRKCNVKWENCVCIVYERERERCDVENI